VPIAFGTFSKSILMKKKAVAVFFTDTHLEEKTIELNKSIWKQVDEIAIKLDVPAFHGGDIFKARKSQSQSVLDAFGEILDDFKSELYAISGNHDKVNQDLAKSYLTTFRYYPNLTLYEDYMNICVSQDITIHMMPYFSEDVFVEKFKGCLENDINFVNENDVRFADKNVFFSHLSVNGVKNNDSNIVTNKISQDLFKDFDLVFLGHYHDRSKVGENIQYIGSTHQGNFGEDEAKGCAILYDDLSYEFIQLDFPAYITEPFDLDIDKADYISATHKKYKNSKDYVRFIFYGTEEQTKTIDRQLYETDGIKVIIDSDGIEARESFGNFSFKKFTKSSILNDEFSEFCEKEGYDFEKGSSFLKKHFETNSN